jgi:hypothetical protein
MGRMAMTTRDKKSVCVCVWRRNRGPKQWHKTEGSARANVEVFSSNRRKREGNPDDLKLRIWRDYPKSFTVEPRDLDPVWSAGVGYFSTRRLRSFFLIWCHYQLICSKVDTPSKLVPIHQCCPVLPFFSFFLKELLVLVLTFKKVSVGSFVRVWACLFKFF